MDGDTSLDFFSEDFDPIKALSSVTLQPPVNIKPFDYLEKCRILLDPSDPNYLPISTKLIEKQKQQHAKKAVDPPVSAPESSAGPSAEPTQGHTATQDHVATDPAQDTARQPPSTETNANAPKSEAAKKKTVLQTMMDELQHGPVALLHECCAQRARVRVVIRRVRDIRGHCTGQLIAYDKHFNLLLKNVTEEFTRQARARDPSGERDPSAAATTTATVQTRRVKQLLIKGDSVVLVSRVTE